MDDSQILKLQSTASVPINDPEVPGRTRNLKFHHYVSEDGTFTPVRSVKRPKLEISESHFHEPWMRNVVSNLETCHEAMKKEIEFIGSLISREFLLASSPVLLTCEQQILKLASYPCCTDGVIFFTTFSNDADERYVRFLESGCYTNFMSQTGLEVMSNTLNIPEEKICLSQIFTQKDISDKSSEYVDSKMKRPRPDKILKNNASLLKENVEKTVSLAIAKGVSLKYFLHIAGKGCRADLSNIPNDKWFINYDLDEKFFQQLDKHLIDFPLGRPEVCKCDMDFSEEKTPLGSPLARQSMFLNYLSNDPYRYLKGKPVRFHDRFPTSSNPASLRHKVMHLFERRDYAQIIDLIGKTRTDQVSKTDDSTCIPESDAAVDLSKSSLKHVPGKQKKTVTSDSNV